MHQVLLEQSVRLKALAMRSLGDCVGTQARHSRLHQDFRDGAGQLREVDRYLIARLAGDEHLPHQHSSTADILAWRDVMGGSKWIPSAGPGAYASNLAHSSVELWTEVELSTLHAASRIDARNGKLSERTISAAQWLTSELQPDNATGRPWGAHVFLYLGHVTNNIEALMYADTLIHNTLVAGSGTPEPLSAAILLDGADWIDDMIRALEQGSSR